MTRYLLIYPPNGKEKIGSVEMVNALNSDTIFNQVHCGYVKVIKMTFRIDYHNMRAVKAIEELKYNGGPTNKTSSYCWTDVKDLEVLSDDFGYSIPPYGE